MHCSNVGTKLYWCESKKYECIINYSVRKYVSNFDSEIKIHFYPKPTQLRCNILYLVVLYTINQSIFQFVLATVLKQCLFFSSNCRHVVDFHLIICQDASSGQFAEIAASSGPFEVLYTNHEKEEKRTSPTNERSFITHFVRIVDSLYLGVPQNS